MFEESPLLRFLLGDSTGVSVQGEGMSLLLAEARSCGVIGRVADTLTAVGTNSLVLAMHRDQILAAKIHADSFKQHVWRELAHIERAIGVTKSPPILLKGASYIYLDLPSAAGRTFSDIDLLVHKSQIGLTEAALMLGGWSTGKPSAYDHRYYREWSHEIPPMTHLYRGTTIDLHHSLAMPTCRIRIDSQEMLSSARPASPAKYWWRLRDEDILLHAASHLLLNSEFERGLRDIWDIDLLYRHFVSLSPEFPTRLLARAQEVGLSDILARVMWLSNTLLATPLPEHWPYAKRDLLRWLVSRAISTRHPSTKPRYQGIADSLLMLREMYLRLPNRLLFIHLVHKISTVWSVSKNEKA